MDSKRESRSHDAARTRLQQRIGTLSDDDRLREALRLHDELLALRREFPPLRGGKTPYSHRPEADDFQTAPSPATTTTERR